MSYGRRRRIREAAAERPRREAETAIMRGHKTGLRELLVLTASEPHRPYVEAYFSAQVHDEELLVDLLRIAAEGEDAGDAPWAAANLLELFPSLLLTRHEAELEELSAHPWGYLSLPARRALSKAKAQPQQTPDLRQS